VYGYNVISLLWGLGTNVMERISFKFPQINSAWRHTQSIGVLPWWNNIPRSTIYSHSTALRAQYYLNYWGVIYVLGISHCVRRVIHGCNRHDCGEIWNQLRCSSSYIPGCRRVRTRTSYFIRRHFYCKVKCWLRNHRWFSCF